MLIDLAELVPRFDMQISGVLHVGAHLGEEAEKYAECGITNVWWVEGNPELIAPLSDAVRRYGHKVVFALVTERDDVETVLHVANNGQSSSVLDFGTHRQVSPDVHYVGERTVRSVTLDTLALRHGITGCNFLNMDLQGAELLALQGAEHTLQFMDYLYLEVNVDELYVGCARLPQLDAFLGERGFQRVEVRMAGEKVGWGDGLWVRAER